MTDRCEKCVSEVRLVCPHNELGRSVIVEASELVAGARNADYGHPLDNHSTTASLFNTYLHRKYGMDGPHYIDADDVCWFNILQKCSRDANAPKRDNLVDVAGYAENIQIVRDERARRWANRTA